MLAAEVSCAGCPVAWPEVAAGALARSRRPITAVVRIGGSRPIADLSLAPVLARVARWRDAGVAVAGVEIDHDCATAALADYAAWLARSRPPPPLRFSITALPTWIESGDRLAALAAAVDELVVQVHAVRAPEIFDPIQATAWVDRFAAAVGERPVWVALPTYRVSLGSADPLELQRFVAGLRRSRPDNVVGVAWFRLPVEGDTAAWAAPTLAAVIRGDPLRPQIGVELIERGPGRFDIALRNRGTIDGPWPALDLRGAVAADLVAGYTPTSTGWSPPARALRAGARAVVGWATGKEIDIDAR